MYIGVREWIKDDGGGPYHENGKDELKAPSPLYRRDELVVVADCGSKMYVTQTVIPEKGWTKELFPLLAEGPFRLVSQQGLMKKSSVDLAAI